MIASIPPLFALAIDPTWIIPFMGGAGFVFALMLGRQLILSKTSATDDDQEQPLTSDFLKGVTQDRRASPRRKGNIVEVEVKVTPQGDEPLLRGLVIDRSQGGLRLLLDVALDEGFVVKVRPTAVGSAAMWAEVTIRSCKREGTQYKMGCQFHQMPSWNQLLQFG